MLRLASSIDRRLLFGGLIMLASTALLAVGIVSIIVALSDDPANLPNEGSLQEILGDDNQQVIDSGEWTPPSGPAPVRLIIPRLFIDAPVLTMTMDGDRVPEVPDRPDAVAWYDFSAPPGLQENAVFSGHVDWQTQRGVGIPGVFYRLRDLQIGDTVRVLLEDDTELEYRVIGNVAADVEDPNVVKAMYPNNQDVITLVTCGGTWLPNRHSPIGGTYSHRIVVRAELVEGGASVAAAPAD